MENPEEVTEGDSGGVNQLELVQSYLAFGKRALQASWKLAASVVCAGVALTCLANTYVPRTYACSTVLMAVGNPVLEGWSGGNTNPLYGASGFVLRHENLENMIRQLGLVEKTEQRLPPLARLRNRLSSVVSGQMSAKDKESVLLRTLESKIIVTGEGPQLTIEADWSDPTTAAELAASAQESFLKARHSAEVSTFEEKVGILDEHANKLRVEIEQLASQINTQTERATAQPAASAPVSNLQPTRPVQRQLATPRAAKADVEMPILKENLDTEKKKLSELEAEQDRRLREEQAKLADLKLKLTPAHPEVVQQQQRVTLVSQTPAEILSLRADVAGLTEQLKQRETLDARVADAPGGLVNPGGPSTADPLSSAVVQALQKNDTDPALSEQLTGAVTRYGSLRDDIRSGRIGLDTAQAIFNRRYQILVPVEAPSKPSKPKASVIWGAGLAVSCLLAFLFPILLELRKGVIVERWQVQQLQLPILAELRLPPSSE